MVKYQAKKCKTKDGTWVRSQYEKAVYEEALHLGRDFRYEPFNKEYMVLEKKKYTPDFVLPNGVWVEVKGYFPREQRNKMKSVKRSHPNQVICILFQENNKLFRGSKTCYLDWARKNGFRAALGTVIPKDWFELDIKEI